MKVLADHRQLVDRLTNRWTAEKGDTFYAYDAVGNLTNVNYPGSAMDIALQFDSLNRLTNLFVANFFDVVLLTELAS